ncbi:hypothetical protein [Azospirillum agricola]|uniref:hypothetical protein n=1 Tax=Azospirillum agricola TaxID=1720247 RepID=UPI000A0F32A6|nr:hypothetical protein [Azospirillum agricola]SMH35461.1 hypothetical protein SAMN02982994_0872 [Azospirillum lipoferum]
MDAVGRSGALPVIASLLLLGLFTAAGLSALPLRGAPPSLFFTPAVPDPLPALSGGIPVLTLRADRTTIRSGYATREATDQPGGRLRVTLYDPYEPLLAQASEGVLFSADLRTLWMLATDEERTRLREGFTELAQSLRRSADAILHSPEFNADYRPALQEAARNAIEAAWRSPRTRAAYDEMMRGAEPVLRDTALREIRPILLRRVDGLIWDTVQANIGTVLDVFNARPWNTAPIEQALEGALRDIRDQGVMERMVASIFETRQTKAFLQVFAGTTMDMLAADRTVENTLVRLATDPRMTAYLTPMAQPANALSLAAPRILFGVRDGSDLNAMAAYTFNGLIAGRPGPVVILMSPQQRDEMLRLDSRAPKLLVRSLTP